MEGASAIDGEVFRERLGAACYRCEETGGGDFKETTDTYKYKFQVHIIIEGKEGDESSRGGGWREPTTKYCHLCTPHKQDRSSWSWLKESCR